MSKRFIIIIVTFIAILLILVGFYLLGRKKPVESFSSNLNYSSSISNIIKHGSFDSQQHISNSKVGTGNDIITYPNPGDSSYVLRQSSQHANVDDNDVLYRIRLSLNNKKTYKLSCWVCLSDEWNGSNYIFNLRIFNMNHDNVLKKSEGTQISSKKMYKILWTQFEYILEFNPNETGEVNWLLGFQPNNTDGYRYITGVSVSLFNPLLSDFKLTYGLQLLTNTYQDSSYNSSNLIWKDISNNGRDFQWSTMTSIHNDGGVNTNSLDIRGPKNSSLGIDTNRNFTIMWLAKYRKKEKCLDGHNIYEIFSLYTQNNDLPYIRVAIDVYYQQLVITIGHITYPGISLGTCQSQSLYSLIKNGNRFFIRKDDSQLHSSELFIYQGSEKITFSTQKNLVINPHKNLNSEIYAFLIYDYSLNYYEIEMVQSYLDSIKKSNNYDVKPCCPEKKESCGLTNIEDEFNIPIDSEDILNQEIEHYESKPFQYSYYNNPVNIPRERKNSSYQVSPDINNSKTGIEHFVSSRTNKGSSGKEEDSKMSDLKKILVEQNIYPEEETTLPPSLEEKKFPEEEEDPFSLEKEFGLNESLESPLEKIIKKKKKKEKKEDLLLPQKLDESETSELYEDESNQSNKRVIAEETEEELQKTSDPNYRESLKLKLKLLKEMIAEEEEEMIKNPLSKVTELIDPQGETVEEANYEPFQQDSCFNRVPQSNENKCQVDMNKYIKKSDVDNLYISKTEVNKDYVKKNNIPCWGCNLD